MFRQRPRIGYRQSFITLTPGQHGFLIYRHEVMQPGDNPPIGLLLCTDYSDTLVQYSTEGLSDIYVGKYMLHLPSTETIRQYLIDHMPKQSEDESESNQ